MDKNRGIDTKLPGTERKMKLNYDKAQLEAVVDKVAERTMNMDMTWDWPCGVAYYGMNGGL